MERNHGLMGVQNDICYRGESSVRFFTCCFLLFMHIFCNIIIFLLFYLVGQAVAQMAAIGFGLPKDAFTSLMKQVNVFPCLNTSALDS